MDKKASGVAGKICCGIFCGLIGIALPVAEIVIGKTTTVISNINSDSFLILTFSITTAKILNT